ncbi:hypothetical protein FQN50_002387 [Emmonsiellopsis sp. PD_5]|nr:hypothetical protein FQN50_002387 [Emmonsiellopsis sp. PD_5]
MPGYTDKGGLRISFADVFKSSRTLRQEMEAASYKRASAAARGRKASAELAARTGKPAHPPGFYPGSPPGLPPGFPQMVYVPAQTSTAPGQAQQPAPGQAPPTPASNSAPPQCEWTTDDDDNLRRLKAEGMTWKAISTATGRQVHVLKSRWGIIKPAVEYQNKKPAVNEPTPPPQETNTNRHQRRVSFSEPLIIGKAESSYTRTPTPKKKILYVDENFSLEEILLLNQLAVQYDNEKWLRISSRFFDKTGKRLSPQEAKEHVQKG